MSFFIKNKGRKRIGGKSTTKIKSKKSKSSGRGLPIPSKKPSVIDDEDIDSDEEIVSDEEASKRADMYPSSEEEEETVQEKKLRLAKEYLSHIETEEKDKREDEEIGKDIISHRLKQDLLEQSGKLQKKVADTYQAPSVDDIITLRGHQLSVTCVVFSPDSRFVYSGSKDCSIIKWSVEERRRVKTVYGGRKGTENKHIGHTAHILCMAISSDGKYLASGDRNKLIHIWNPDTLELLHTFKGHRDVISGLVFRRDSHQLFSASNDRSIKIWHVDERAYVETLFGHHDCVTGIDSLTRERAVSCGGRDNTVRVWKVIEESQLVFNGHMCSIDCIALINESNFVSGADDNTLCLWNTLKKKPVLTVKNAHHGEGAGTGVMSGKSQENWITAVAAFVNTDLIASGSKDGNVRLWKCGGDYRTLHPLFNIPVVGFVNSLKFSRDGQYLVAGVGQEHRLGRWWRMKEAKNCVCVIPLRTKPS